MKRVAAILVISMGMLIPAFAIQPGEVLDDPVLEQRARQLSAGLRCMVCQNQSIDDSDAELARDLRILVRERVAAGETDEEVIDYIVSRYGEFVLLRPRFNLRNALLWATPVVLLFVGALAIGFASRRRRAVERPLSHEEEHALDQVLRDAD